MQFGYSGKTSATYRALWEYFVEQTGIVPPMAIYAAYSPNDGPGNPISGANATDLNSFIAHSTTNNIVTAIWTGLPSSKWTPSYVETESNWSQSADANRVAYNASIVAGTFGADFVIDQAPQFEILGTGSGGVGTAYGMIASLTNGGYANPAGWHPDYVGYTAMIDSFSSVLTAPINDYFA